MYNVFDLCHRLGMKKRPTVTESALEALKDKLRENPELFESVAEVVDLSAPEAPGTDLKFAGFEQRLVPRIRRLGQTAMRTWAEAVEGEAAAALKSSDPTVRQREKKR